MTCECGCGGSPSKGRFLPGHDAILNFDILKRFEATYPTLYSGIKEACQQARGEVPDGFKKIPQMS